MDVLRKSMTGIVLMIILVPFISSCSTNFNERIKIEGNSEKFLSMDAEETREVIAEALGSTPDDFANKAIIHDDGSLSIILYGSSSCPLEPESIEVNEDNVLRVNIKEVDDGRACTADIGPNNGYKIDTIPKDTMITSGEAIYSGDIIVALEIYS